MDKFPTCGKFWKQYIEHEMKNGNYENVEKLFKRCLVSVLSLDLWKVYLAYIRETKDKHPTYREKMRKAYDFAIEKIGLDLQSYPIWNDYINFLRNIEVQGSFAENQRISHVRKVFQRGVVTPMSNIENLWKDYNTYEQSINPLIAKKMIDDKNKEYLNSRRATKELEVLQRNLMKSAPAQPATGGLDERKVVESWRKLIEWEKGNNLRIEDKHLQTRRVMFAYEQCLLVLGHHPEMWYEAAQFLVRSSQEFIDAGEMHAGKRLGDEAAELYKRATGQLMKRNPLIHFAYANFEESRGNYETVTSIYTKLTDISELDPTLTFIQYMRFARRTEGIKAARQVFRLAREDGRIKYHVFIAAAWMEYYCAKDKNLAFKIFELGLKRFADKPDYVRQYMDFMSNMNDDNNTRVLYERVLSEEADKMESVWNKYLDFECHVGDLTSILKVENRRLERVLRPREDELLGDGPKEKRNESALLIDRYRFLDLFPCTREELRSMGYKDAGSLMSELIPSAEKTPKTPHQVLNQIVHHQNGGLNVPVDDIGYAKPDINHMIPFKPRRIPVPGSHPVSGGEFPMPQTAHNALKLMPPPVCFHGPFVRVDDLIDKFRSGEIPNIDEFVRNKNTKVGQKRNAQAKSQDESAVGNDVFRQRQQKRAKT